jgi:hypothetical protein
LACLKHSARAAVALFIAASAGIAAHRSGTRAANANRDFALNMLVSLQSVVGLDGLLDFPVADTTCSWEGRYAEAAIHDDGIARFCLGLAEKMRSVLPNHPEYAKLDIDLGGRIFWMSDSASDLNEDFTVDSPVLHYEVLFQGTKTSSSERLRYLSRLAS